MAFTGNEPLPPRGSGVSDADWEIVKRAQAAGGQQWINLQNFLSSLSPAGTVSGTGGKPTTAVETGVPATGDRSGFAVLARVLDSYGLQGLYSVDASGQPSGWLWDQVTSGNDTEARLYPLLKQTPQYQSQYGVKLDLERRRAAGEPVAVPTESDIMSYRASFASTMAYYQMPKGFYDERSDADSMMAKGFTLQQISTAIDAGYQQVRQAPASVRDAFARFYGVQGDAQLAAFFLDPERITAGVEKYADAALVAGRAADLGFGQMTKITAQRLADLGVPEANAALTKAQTLSPLGRGTATEDAVVGGDQILAAAGLDESTRLMMEQRARNRPGQLKQGGTAAGSVSGIVGVGTQPQR